MNSSQLKKDYPEVYKKFFNNYDLIISVPMPIEMSGIMSRYVNSSMFSFNAPVRHYIGINIKKGNGLTPFTYKNNIIDGFHESYMENLFSIDIKNIHEFKISDYEIGYLCEYNRYAAFEMICLLAVGELLVTKEITLDDIQNLNLQNNYQKTLNLITEKFATIEKHLTRFLYHSTGYKAYIGAMCLQNNLCTLYHDDTFIGLNNSSNSKNIDLAVYFLNVNKPMTSVYQGDFLHHLNKKSKLQTKEFNISYNDDLLEGVRHMEKYFSSTLYTNFGDLYKYKTEGVDFFINHEMYFQLILSIAQKNKEEFNNYLVKQKIKEITGNFNVPLSTNVGSTRIIMYTQKSLSLNSSIIQTLNKELNTQFTLDYASPVDGFDTEGIKVEQYISEGIYSPFCSPYRTIIFQNTEITHGHGEYKEIIENWKDGLLLNEVDNKIYLFGKKLTSQEIHSQSATIELLHHLMQYPGQEISNKELTPSAYSKNKNDMVGKIIKPLQKYIAKHSTHKIDIHCKGSINAFTITLENTSLPVMLLYPANNTK